MSRTPRRLLSSLLSIYKDKTSQPVAGLRSIVSYLPARPSLSWASSHRKLLRQSPTPPRTSDRPLHHGAQKIRSSHHPSAKATLISAKQAQQQFDHRLQRRHELEKKKKDRPDGSRWLLLIPNEVWNIILPNTDAKDPLSLAGTSRSMRQAFLPFALERLVISCGWRRISYDASPEFKQAISHWHLLNPLHLVYPVDPRADEPVTIPQLPRLLTLDVRKPVTLTTAEPAVVTLQALILITALIAKSAPSLERLSVQGVLTDTIANIPFETMQAAWMIPAHVVGQRRVREGPLQTALSSLTLTTSLSKTAIKGRCLASFFRALGRIPTLVKLELKFEEDHYSSRRDKRCIFGVEESKNCCVAHLVKAIAHLSSLRDLTIGTDTLLFADDKRSCLMGHLVRFTGLFQGLTRLSVPLYLECALDAARDILTSLSSSVVELELRLQSDYSSNAWWELLPDAFERDHSRATMFFASLRKLERLVYRSDTPKRSSYYRASLFARRYVFNRSQGGNPPSMQVFYDASGGDAGV